MMSVLCNDVEKGQVWLMVYSNMYSWGGGESECGISGHLHIFT